MPNQPRKMARSAATIRLLPPGGGTCDMTLSPRLQTPGWVGESVLPSYPVSAVSRHWDTRTVRWFFVSAARGFVPGGRAVYQIGRRAQWPSWAFGSGQLFHENHPHKATAAGHLEQGPQREDFNGIEPFRHGNAVSHRV